MPIAAAVTVPELEERDLLGEPVRIAARAASTGTRR
jgi:hypothetical protein